jgi:Fur family transcriptional regulator, ferric uptake regulator
MPKIGQRKTQQREIIIEIIAQSPGPVTVNDILRIADEQKQGMGIATIYRTIKLLLESEIICEVNLPDGQSRYEKTKKAHHHHFHCNKCGNVIDINECCGHFHKIVDGHHVESHEITLFGICKNCL